MIQTILVKTGFMCRLIGLTALALCVMNGSPAFAQQQVGRGVVDGREIVIYGNGTWRYFDDVNQQSGGGGGLTKGPKSKPQPQQQAQTVSCDGLVTLESAKTPFVYCLSADRWLSNDAEGAYEGLYQTKDDKIFFGVIPEDTPIALKALRAAIIKNARDGVAPNEINILRERVANFNGAQWSVIDYSAEVEGLNLSFRNYYLSGDGYALQSVFWTETSTFNDLLPEIENVMATTKVGR